MSTRGCAPSCTRVQRDMGSTRVTSACRTLELALSMRRERQGERLVRRLHGLQMMQATVWWSAGDVYTRLSIVLHACAAGHELHSRHMRCTYA